MSNSSKLKVSRAIIYLWLSAGIGLFIVGPFLPQPLRTYIGHATYVVFFGGIIAAVIAVKVWIAPYMPDRTSGRKAEPRPPVDKGAVARIRAWNIVVGLASLAALLLLPRLGVRFDREQIYAAMLGISVVAIGAYYAARYVRQRQS